MEAQEHQTEIPGTQSPEAKKSGASIYAVIQNALGEVTTVSAKQKKDLAKTLANFPDCKVLGVFKGKQLQAIEKKTFNFFN